MNLRFKTNLLEHTKAVGAWARQRAARVQIDAIDLKLSVRHEGRDAQLHPQFVGKRDGLRLVYFDVADVHATGFVGWLPYKPQAWDISLSKLAFKAAARTLDLPVPAHWTDPSAIDAPFLVKRERGAFGDGMHGPYAAAAAAGLRLAPGEYAEAYTRGRIARAWYWCSRLAVLEMFAMPVLQGDGHTPCRALLQQAGVSDVDEHAALLALQDLAADDVPAAGRQVVADYRYVSPLNPTVYRNHDVLPRLAGSDLARRFEDAGRRLWPRIPGPPERQIGFVLDAIVDAQDRPWFLEVNSNPQGHPGQYGAMLDGLFGLPAGAGAGAEQ